MAERPKNLHPSRSFTRLESVSQSPLSRSQASTMQESHMPEILDPLKAITVPEDDEGDVFAKRGQEEEDGADEPQVPDTFEELPIEIRSLTERFLESLTAKVHPTPLSADALSDMFQEFYGRASGKINTHIATLSARLTSEAFVANAKRGTSPSSRPGSIRKGSDPSGEQQMLSAAEMADRKKARRSLETKRYALEEAVERAVCEKVYQRIWRHRSTDDEERDHKLRSRTASLALVGIGLKELLMTGEELTEEEREKAKEKEPEIREYLSAARQDLLKMNDEKYPLGKVQHLTAAHKSIVEALSKIFPATSSADEILPTLIYALITMPPVYLNVISDLNFIQRFRGSSRMDGETAYCLVNLEAAISFLETVDLSSLRAEEAAHGKLESRPSTPKQEITPMSLGLSEAPDLIQTPATPVARSVPKEPSSPTTNKAQRRLSNLIQSQTNKIEAASDAVRDSILDSADQALGRINTTLDTSFKFFFGGLRDKHPGSPILEQPALPKTLEDAMKLVSSPTREHRDEDNLSVSAASSVQGEEHHETSSNRGLGLDAKMADIFAGKRQIRDRSVDSTKSGGSTSGRRVAFASTPAAEEKAASPAAVKTTEPPTANTSAVDSLRNMGNTFNPLNRFSGMNVLPRFARAVSSSTTPVLASPVQEQAKVSPSPEPLSRSNTNDMLQTDEKGVRAVAALEQLKKTPPPMKRFVEAKDAQDLKLKEVEELLKEYQRLNISPIAYMAESMSHLSPEKMNANADSIIMDDDIDMACHDRPSSPFMDHIEIVTDDQENIAPNAVRTPVKSLVDVDDNVPQSAFRVSPEKRFGLKERTSPMKTSPMKNLMDDYEDAEPKSSAPTPKKSNTPRPIRDNEGLTAAMKFMDETPMESHERSDRPSSRDYNDDVDFGMDNIDFNPDGPEPTSLDFDDTCFTSFSEMPGIDMTKFASLKQSPTKSEAPDATPRARTQMTPSTVRRSERTPSPTPRRSYKDNDTTNLLLDFTAQIESFSSSRHGSSSRVRPTPSKSTTEPNLRSYYQSQRSPAKGGSQVPSTPSQSRHMLNLLDFELPPPPTPRSLPTVTIRELESVKSQFQSQVSSLTASLSGKEAEIGALSKAIADAERRVGEAQETVREERSAREYAETQMVDWKSKGEEVQRLLQDVQSEMARNDAERDDLLARLAEAERRAEDAENRSSELETKVIEAESKNVDMTTFIHNDEGDENKKIYSEMECQAAIAEKVNEVARDLHTAYKAKHEKKIKALKDNYQKKADERCKELRVQITRLERQVEEAEKKRDNTFSKISPGENDDDSLISPSKSTRNAEDAQMLEAQRAEIENLKAKLAGLQSELQSLRKSHDSLVEDLEAERIEKGELVAAAEQMLSMCGEKMEELQQEDLRRSQMEPAPPTAPQQQATGAAAPQQAMRNTGFLAGGPAPSRPGSSLGGGRPGSSMSGPTHEHGNSTSSTSGIAKPSGLRGPGGMKFQGNSALNRSQSNAGKSRLLSNIERMGGGKTQE
ncbi:hypothetical protein CFE70_009745 [Pyrenophora teres f. teres 0-1]